MVVFPMASHCIEKFSPEKTTKQVLYTPKSRSGSASVLKKLKMQDFHEKSKKSFQKHGNESNSGLLKPSPPEQLTLEIFTSISRFKPFFVLRINLGMKDM